MKMDVSDRSCFNFENKVRETFAFLADFGFYEIEASATLVRYQKDDVEVDIYHGCQSFEIGASITCFGTRYAISEIIRTADVETAKQYRNAMATTPEIVAVALEKLSSLMKCYGNAVLKGDQQICLELKEQRNQWPEEYALDVLADQLRPQADEAFRRGNYSTAAELYARFRERLSPAETKKLKFAEERRAGK
jgi:phenylalanyl-tRNA synthetase beta subunit